MSAPPRRPRAPPEVDCIINPPTRGAPSAPFPPETPRGPLPENLTSNNASQMFLQPPEAVNGPPARRNFSAQRAADAPGGLSAGLFLPTAARAGGGRRAAPFYCGCAFLSFVALGEGQGERARFGAMSGSDQEMASSPTKKSKTGGGGGGAVEASAVQDMMADINDDDLNDMDGVHCAMDAAAESGAMVDDVAKVCFLCMKIVQSKLQQFVYSHVPSFFRHSSLFCSSSYSTIPSCNRWRVPWRRRRTGAAFARRATVSLERWPARRRPRK